MSRTVFCTLSSMVSGTIEPIIRPNSVSSLTKKKEMNRTEKSPTAMPATADATEPKMEGIFDKSTTSDSFWMSICTPSKSSPTQGTTPIIQSLIRLIRLWVSIDSCAFIKEASRRMPETTGTTCIIRRKSSTKMTRSVITASRASGADLPFILIFFRSLKTGCPISDTTKARRM